MTMANMVKSSCFHIGTDRSTFAKIWIMESGPVFRVIWKKNHPVFRIQIFIYLPIQVSGFISTRLHHLVLYNSARSGSENRQFNI
jgi:hypothetical protein